MPECHPIGEKKYPFQRKASVKPRKPETPVEVKIDTAVSNGRVLDKGVAADDRRPARVKHQALLKEAP